MKLRLTVCLGERKCGGMERKGMVDCLEDLKNRGGVCSIPFPLLCFWVERLFRLIEGKLHDAGAAN